LQPGFNTFPPYGHKAFIVLLYSIHKGEDFMAEHILHKKETKKAPQKTLKEKREEKKAKKKTKE
jgi:hypothetical protein